MEACLGLFPITLPICCLKSKKKGFFSKKLISCQFASFTIRWGLRVFVRQTHPTYKVWSKHVKLDIASPSHYHMSIWYMHALIIFLYASLMVFHIHSHYLVTLFTFICIYLRGVFYHIGYMHLHAPIIIIILCEKQCLSFLHLHHPYHIASCSHSHVFSKWSSKMSHNHATHQCLQVIPWGTISYL